MRLALWIAAVVLAAVGGALGQTWKNETLPTGIILPVRLDNSISSKKAKAGQIFKGRIMQNVPLPDGGRVREGAHVEGHVVAVTPATAGAGARISIEIDKLIISHTTMPIRTSLRAIAGPLDIQDARLPAWGADRGTPENAYTTIQVGGDVVYRGGGHVMRHGAVVAEPVWDGVVGRLQANEDGDCRGDADGDEQPQALWLFSTDACGAYGFGKMEILDAGRTNEQGEIVFATKRGDLNLRAGTGMLLRVRKLGKMR